MDIRKIHVDSMNEAAYNPRKVGAEEMKRLKKSIKQFGYIDPIIWNEASGNIVGGHVRYRVLRGEGYKEIEVVVVNLPPDEEKALNLSLNKSAGQWDEQKLDSLLNEIKGFDLDIELTGFGAFEVDQAVQRIARQQLAVERSSFLNSAIQENAPTVKEYVEQQQHAPESQAQPQASDAPQTSQAPSSGRPTYEPPAYPPQGTYPTPDTTVKAGEWVKIAYAVTPQQRDVIIEAIGKAKEEFGVTLSQDALVEICKFYNEN